MNIADDITRLIGKTPLVRLCNLFDDSENTVVAKLEQNNPGASVKDRAALAMINAAEESGQLKPGGTIIEATSGNTGIALSYIAAVRKYRTIIVMPESMSIERSRLLTAFGALVELTPANLGMGGSIERARKLAATTENSFLVNQFSNSANPRVHEQTTAEEILSDTDGKVEVFIAGAGTGGTVSGVGKRLKKYNPEIEIIAVEPASSNVLSGGRSGAHMVQGIGPGFIPENFNRAVVDKIIAVGDQEVYHWTRRIMCEEGILAGISAGAVACAADKYIRASGGRSRLIVTLFPDTGERYLSLPMLFRD